MNQSTFVFNVSVLKVIAPLYFTYIRMSLQCKMFSSIQGSFIVMILWIKNVQSYTIKKPLLTFYHVFFKDEQLNYKRHCSFVSWCSNYSEHVKFIFTQSQYYRYGKIEVASLKVQKITNRKKFRLCLHELLFVFYCWESVSHAMTKQT